MPPDTHTSLRLALGQLEDALGPQEAASLAGALIRVAAVLCAYAAAEQPGNELLAQLHDAIAPAAAAAEATSPRGAPR